LNILPYDPHSGSDGVLLGIRPEDVILGDVGLPARVQSVEYLGADTVVTCAYGNQMLIARVPGKATFAPGTTIYAGWRPDNLHFFDAATGMRCEGSATPDVSGAADVVSNFS
jgi:sn-glycerol 3-phosphate transport system ATP-binding protein